MARSPTSSSGPPKRRLPVVASALSFRHDSSYYDLHPSSSTDREAIEQSGASCELRRICSTIAGASALRGSIGVCFADALRIRFDPNEDRCRKRAQQSGPILSVMRGNHLDTLVTDQATGARILELAKEGGERS